MTCSSGKTNTTENIRFSYFCAHFLCGEMSPTGRGWSIAREASQPFLHTPVPETVPFLVPRTHISKEVKCCFPHLSTYKTAQVRQGVRSSTITERHRVNVQLSSCIHLSCWQPAAEPVLPVQHKHEHVPTPPCWTKETWPYEALQGQEVFRGASKPNALTLPPLLRYAWRTDRYPEHIPQNASAVMGFQIYRMERSQDKKL